MYAFVSLIEAIFIIGCTVYVLIYSQRKYIYVNKMRQYKSKVLYIDTAASCDALYNGA